MELKYIRTLIAFFMLIGGTFSVLSADDPETLDGLKVRSIMNLDDLDLSRETILSNETIESRQINSLEGLNGLSPNLHLSGSGIKSFGDVITMRGIGNTLFFGSPGVQLYVDGVPQGNVFSYGSDLYDLDAVEIYKGPQVSQFGKLAPGGAINLITKKPNDSISGKASASFATFNTQKYNLSNSGHINEDFSYSLGIQRSLSDGFLDNSSGRDNDSETWNGRLNLYWDGGTGTKASLGASFTSHELGAQPLVLRNQANFYARSVNEDEFTKIEENQQFLKLEHEIELGILTSITSRNDWDMSPNILDIDFLGGSHKSTIIQDQEVWSQEMKIDFDINDQSEFTFGVLFSDEEITGTPSRFVGMDIDTNYSIGSKNIAGFLHYSKLFDPDNTVFLNARLDGFERSIKRTNSLSVPINQQKDFNLLSGSVGWNHKLSNSSFLNLLIGYAQKPGGFSAFTSDLNQVAFQEEKILSYDIGVTFEPSESLKLAFGGFLNDVEDYQFELNGAGMDYYLENANDASIYGIEIDCSWKIGDGWSFVAFYGITKSEFKQVDALPELVGKQITFVPDRTLALALKHQIDSGLFYQIGTRTIGKTYFWDNTGNNGNDVIDSYTLLEAQIGYSINNWEINIFGNNLTDEEYYTSIVTNLGFGNGNNPGVVGSPRVIGLSISRDF